MFLIRSASFIEDLCRYNNKYFSSLTKDAIHYFNTDYLWTCKIKGKILRKNAQHMVCYANGDRFLVLRAYPGFERNINLDHLLGEKTTVNLARMQFCSLRDEVVDKCHILACFLPKRNFEDLYTIFFFLKREGGSEWFGCLDGEKNQLTAIPFSMPPLSFSTDTSSEVTPLFVRELSKTQRECYFVSSSPHNYGQCLKKKRKDFADLDNDFNFYFLIWTEEEGTVRKFNLFTSDCLKKTVE